MHVLLCPLGQNCPEVVLLRSLETAHTWQMIFTSSLAKPLSSNAGLSDTLSLVVPAHLVKTSLLEVVAMRKIAAAVGWEAVVYSTHRCAKAQLLELRNIISISAPRTSPALYIRLCTRGHPPCTLQYSRPTRASCRSRLYSRPRQCRRRCIRFE